MIWLVMLYGSITELCIQLYDMLILPYQLFTGIFMQTVCQFVNTHVLFFLRLHRGSVQSLTD